MNFLTSLFIVLSLLVSFNGEMVRYNPSNSRIEYSSNQGRSWYSRYTGSSIGQVKSMIAYGNELILCSDRGVFYSSNSGRSWYSRSASHKDFIDIADAGKELLATTADGHLYYSTNSGRTWFKRK